MAWPERFGRRHYGLHGLSHAYALRRGRACRPFSRTAPHSALPPGSWRLAGGRFRPASRSPPPRASRPWRTRRHGPPRAAVITTPGRRSVSTCTGCATRSPPWTGRTCWCSPACRCRRRGRVSSVSSSTKTAAPPMMTGRASAIRFVPRPGLRPRASLSPSPPADQYLRELQSLTREFHGCDQAGRARSWMPGPAQLAATQAADTRN